MKADVFILIGLSSSNQRAGAIVKALQNKNDKVQIIYAGKNLSSTYPSNTLDEIQGKSVYTNIIAKNFATLKPGILFRVIFAMDGEKIWRVRR